MSTELTDERAAFEKAMLDYGVMRGSLQRSGDGYTFMNLAWAAWQARALADRAAQQEPAGWQPIETAPTDGTWFLVFGPTARTNSCHMVCRCDGVTFESADDGYQPYINPTHWMPLPAAPSRSGGAPWCSPCDKPRDPNCKTCGQWSGGAAAPNTKDLRVHDADQKEQS